jgi:hypothetical protein
MWGAIRSAARSGRVGPGIVVLVAAIGGQS